MPSNDLITKKDLVQAVQQVIGEINRQNAESRAEMNARFANVNSRFEEVNSRVATIDRKLDDADLRFQQRSKEVNARLADIDKKLDDAELREVERFQQLNKEVNSRFAQIDKAFVAANDHELVRFQELTKRFADTVVKRYDRLDERIEKLEFKVSQSVAVWQESGDKRAGLLDDFKVERYALDHAISRHQKTLDQIQADLAKMNERVSALEAKGA